MTDGDRTIIGAGIDIGTTTTQVVFSKLTLGETGGFGAAKNIDIIGKEIIYLGAVNLTPLCGGDLIDADAVASLIKSEYEAAGLSPKDIGAGAVIITGETVEKRNAERVLTAISDYAGDFVSASAGGRFEAVLAGFGAGAAALSETEKYRGMVVTNIDIGGGTSNLCQFKNGGVLSAECVDIGGRLIALTDGGLVRRVSPRLAGFGVFAAADNDAADTNGKDGLGKPAVCGANGGGASGEPPIFVKIGERLTPQKAGAVAKRLARGLTETVEGLTYKTDAVCFSGGVADCIFSDFDDFKFGDIGMFLGRAIKKTSLFDGAVRPKETLRATVVGAGGFSVGLSGSTVEYASCRFPYKNLPAANVEIAEGDSDADIAKKITAVKLALGGARPDGLFAIGLSGAYSADFATSERLAEILTKALSGATPIIVCRRDMGKAIGKAIARRLPPLAPFISLDGISLSEGDFIDIGAPLCGGKVLPVVIKTLIFNRAPLNRI
ncbi:MAG: ethanolamine ammonia-lyase reactivating factor EutA [Clostridiales bacterium]|jgi:ethanolamine utilization protein EutA|nr:ethanolamine ammonia-lyase reactivating factor EutA [Clostridiales bacterium]